MKPRGRQASAAVVIIVCLGWAWAWPLPAAEITVDAAAIHNSFVAGQASAFVPWQFIEGGQSQHALMSTSGKTKKTQVVRQFSRFVAPGSVRVEASPALGEVMARACGAVVGKTASQ